MTIGENTPRAFNYNGNLMIRGSELLKYPQLYTHMGWINTNESPIIADQYYKFGNNGSFDPTHFTAFNASDTYTPIPEQYIQQILNQAFATNGRLGQSSMVSKQGTISQGPDRTYQEQIRIPLGFSPGADQAFVDYSLNPTKERADNFRSIATTLGASNAAIAGMHPAGAMVFTPTMGASAYDRLSNAKSWQDYVIGTGEGVLAGLSLLGPLAQAYKNLRGIISPKYRLGVELQNELDNGLNWEAYYNHTSQVPQVYNTGVAPKFNATTVVNTSEGRVRYSPDHLSKHFEHPIDDDFVKDIAENAVTRGQHNLSLSNFAGKDNISLIYPNNKRILFTPGKIQVPEQFPNINFSFSNDLEDYSSLGYAFGQKNYTLFKRNDGTIIQVPNPLQRVTTSSDVDIRRPYPLQLFFSGKPYIREGQMKHTFRYVDDPDSDFNLTTAYPITPPIPKGVHNISYVYNGVDAPSYLEFANRFPDVVWNPNGIAPKEGTVFDRWYNNVDKMIEDINSPQFVQHLKRELGSNVDEQFIRRTLNRRLTGTIPFERNVPYGDFPISGAGPFTFEGKFGKGPSDVNFFRRLQQDGKISPKYKTEEEFLNSLSEEEKVAYNRAKAGEEKILGVELPGGDWGSLFNTEAEEGYHIWDIGNSHTPWMKQVDEHNEKLLNLIQPIVKDLGGKEALPRFRWAQNIYRDLESDLQTFYAGKSPSEIPELFYRDFLHKNPKLYKAFPELEEYSKERFFFELKNGYKNNKEFFNSLEHIVYNIQPQSRIINIT